MNKIIPVFLTLLIFSCTTIDKKSIKIIEEPGPSKSENETVEKKEPEERPVIFIWADADIPERENYLYYPEIPVPALEKVQPEPVHDVTGAVSTPSPWEALEERSLYREKIRDVNTPEQTNKSEQPQQANKSEQPQVQARPQSAAADTKSITSDRSTMPAEAQRAIEKPETEEVTVEAGGKAAVILNGTGWLYAGETGSGEEGLSFLSRQSKQQETVFFFMVEREGMYFLDFKRQSPLSGDLVSRRVELKAVKKKESGSSGNDNPSGVPSAAAVQVPGLDVLIGRGDYDTAFNAFDAAEVLKKLLETGVKTGSAEKLIRFKEEVEKDPERNGYLFSESETGDMVTAAGKILIKKGYVLQGRYLLEKILEKKGSVFPGADEILFILGYSYQNNKEFRDERRAFFYYKKLIDEFPASFYWDSAKKEYLFIKRMYIDVR